MDTQAFHQSLQDPSPPAALSLALQGLWWDARGDAARAHRCAQDQHDAAGAAVHAYIHRKQSDLANARYWYARAGRLPATGAFDAEWDALVIELLT